ncbi:unnamed protein product, partial [Amoebophrya sp. A25]
ADAPESAILSSIKPMMNGNAAEDKRTSRFQGFSLFPPDQGRRSPRRRRTRASTTSSWLQQPPNSNRSRHTRRHSEQLGCRNASPA